MVYNVARPRFWLLGAALTFVLVTALTSGATAATFIVDRTDDDPAATACDDATANDCSLRGAIIKANGRVEASTITVPAGTYALASGADCLFKTTRFGSQFFPASTTLCFAGPITLVGAGAAITIIDGGQRHHVAVIGNNAPVEIRGVTLQNGRQDGGSLYGGGGGINVGGSLTLADSVVTDNTATAGGGGIFNSGTLMVVRTTINRNTTGSQQGGGIWNYEHGAVTVVDSVVADNFAAHGGGLSNYTGSMTVTNSTVSGNRAGQGGGIYNAGGNFTGTLALTNTTVSDNRADQGGGLYNAGGSAAGPAVAHLRNVTITDNTAMWFADLTRGHGGGLVNTEFADAARAHAQQNLGTAIPPAIVPDLERYVTTQLQAQVAEGRQAWIASAGTAPRVHSQAHLIIDLAQFGIAQSVLTGHGEPLDTGPSARAGTWFSAVVRWLGWLARAAVSALLEPATAHAQTCSREDGMEWQRCGSCLQPVCCQVGRNCCFSTECPKPPPPPCAGASCSGGGGAAGGTPGGAVDPNDKVGSQGVGAGQFLSGIQPLRYTIFFENLPTADFAAQEVIVTDQLDPATMDLSTFSLGPIDFGGGRTLIPPPGLSEFIEDVDLRPAQNLILRIDAKLNASTGLVTWRFLSLDPTTLQLTDDPVAGFLPPNTGPPEGEGHVVFTVTPKAGLVTGTRILNQARIVFDVNAPIDTPVWFNTIDNAIPTSEVISARPGPGGLDVQWSGSDAGAGIQDYGIYVSENGGAFTPWLRDTTATSGTFPGTCGKSYGFSSVARDLAGNVELAASQADVTAIIACAPHDMAVTRISAPATVTLTGRQPQRTVLVSVQIQNRGSQPQTIADRAALDSLVSLQMASLGGCAAPVPSLVQGKRQKSLPRTLKSRQKLDVVFEVTLGCANDPVRGAGHEDYRLLATVRALGAIDAHPEDDVCPRSVTPPFVVDPFPDGSIRDHGCGKRKRDGTLGGDVLIDVIVRP